MQSLACLRLLRGETWQPVATPSVQVTDEQLLWVKRSSLDQRVGNSTTTSVVSTGVPLVQAVNSRGEMKPNPSPATPDKQAAQTQPTGVCAAVNNCLIQMIGNNSLGASFHFDLV